MEGRQGQPSLPGDGPLLFYFLFFIFVNENVGPSRKIVGRIRGLFGFWWGYTLGSGKLQPQWKTKSSTSGASCHFVDEVRVKTRVNPLKTATTSTYIKKTD